ncbi:hypothetical protein RND81_02G206300 [Saponaria officinalis]|uniref:Uncharacterized protein n=1 Tax=Saponaria officinalis TaxID=3572 RepID=A0AAW1MWF6_SAPOF
MINEHILTNTSPTNKRILEGTNKTPNNNFQPIRDTFSNDLHNDITKTNRPEIFRSLRISNLRDKSNERTIEGFIDNPRAKGLKHHINNVPLNERPTLLIENRGDTV